ncbi:putative cleavage and polyadenylylation specificity [Phaeomoniella chlamydospora]|uniref:Cleavage and polyadenylation specificity factor subunit 2 n=1 Tax=Phaeomoniella chlamydospora TaxID=158046 RepID=A0A0G2EII9_PHACM|nr:putative cleavage and polyadenylylation specificity [Phaeomoniella chlamydospora]
MESIVYAVDWNQARENVIGGAAWFGGIGGAEVIEQLRKPTALICSSKGGDKIALSGGRKKRDALLLEHIRSSLAKGGTVLIPSDSSARVLELAYVLEKAWQEADAADNVIKDSKLYLASKSSVATMRHARSLLEWMDESISREFEGEDDLVANGPKRTGIKQSNGQTAKPGRPFEFKHVKLLERKSQVERMLKAQGPRVIIASDLSLQWGFSKSIIREVCQQTENLVILTDKQSPADQRGKHNVCQVLWEWFEERRDGVALEMSSTGEHLEQVHTGGRELEIKDVQRQSLTPDEEALYQQYIATQRQLQTSLQSRNDTSPANEDDAADDASSSSSEDSDDEHQGRTLNVSAALGHAGRSKAGLNDKDLGVNILLRRKGTYDFDVRGKKGRNAVFPYLQHRKRGDEFGEYIRPEDFLRAEEKEEADQTTSVRESRLGQKRKWEDENKGHGRTKKQILSNGGTLRTGGDGVSAGDDQASDSSDDEGEEKEFEGPAKALFTSTTKPANSRLAYVDFAGLHDRRSLQMLIPLISPRKLILVAGTQAETSSLAQDCKELLAIKEHDALEVAAVDILTPTIGQIVDASVDTNAWVLKLSRPLVKRLHWQNVRNIGIVTITGQLKGEDTAGEADLGSKPKKTKMMKEEPEQELPTENADASGKDLMPVLDVVPANVAAATRLVAHPVHVGDLRLADLRRLMQSAGHAAEFRGEGTLLIDGFIAVRKLGTGKVVVEGAPLTAADSLSAHGSIFYHVKRRIYEGLAIIAGA